MRIDYNECWYQEGEPHHGACTHPNYCIFNKNRIRLESQIGEIERDLELVEWQLSNFHSIHLDKNYADLKKEKNILRDDLERLQFFRAKIIDSEVKEYGYEVLES